MCLILDLFLDFSDVDNKLADICVRDVLEKTFKVLRFRTLTLDVKLSALVAGEGDYTFRDKNKSLLVLSLYLLLNEIITLCSQVDLFLEEESGKRRELTLTSRPSSNGVKFLFKNLDEHLDLRGIDNINFISGILYINSLKFTLYKNGFEVIER